MIDNLHFKLSDDSLQLLPEYNSRLNILTDLGFIDKNKTVLFKGRLSLKFKNNFEIVLTELLLSKELLKMEYEYVAAILSCFIQEVVTFLLYLMIVECQFQTKTDA